ncbi:MAG: SLBB domain-containing protein [Planctomycetota bacterium]
MSTRPALSLRFHLWNTALATLFFCVAAGGCRTGGYQAAKLPDAMRAPSIASKPKIDLASLGTAGDAASRLYRGDLLELTILSGEDGEKKEPTLARVAENGTVDVPVVGAVPVEGLEPTDAGARIAAASVERGFYLRPHVAVEIKTKAVNKITVLGAVQEPGVHEIPRNACDLVSAIAAAGGLAEDASTEVEVLSHQTTSGTGNPYGIPNPTAVVTASATSAPAGPRIARLDLAKATRQSISEQHLADRDVVMVRPTEERLIHVTGVVETPDQFELPDGQDVRLLDAVALAGGPSSPVADKVIILRNRKDGGAPVVINASLGRAKKNNRENLRLAAGDMVSVEQTPATTLLDTLEKLFRISVGTTTNLF